MFSVIPGFFTVITNIGLIFGLFIIKKLSEVKKVTTYLMKVLFLIKHKRTDFLTHKINER